MENILLLVSVKLSLIIDILLLPIPWTNPHHTTRESVVRSSCSVKVKGGTRRKVTAKCLMLTRDKAFQEPTTRPSYIHTYGFISDDPPQWIVRWSSLPKFDLALSDCGKNMTISRGPVDLRFKSNTSPLRHRLSDTFLHNGRWAAESIGKNAWTNLSAHRGKLKAKILFIFFSLSFQVLLTREVLGFLSKARWYDKSFFDDMLTVISNIDVYLSILRRVTGTACKKGRLTWTWQHEVEGLWYMTLSQNCSLGLVPLTESNTP